MRGRTLAIPALVILVVAGLAVWLARGTIAEWLGIADEAQSAGDDRGVNLTEVADNADALFGQEVVVSGEVDELLGPQALLLGNDQLLVGDHVLVLTARPLSELAPSPLVDRAVQVRGEVRPFEPAALRTSLGVDAGGFDYGGKAVIVAAKITPAEEQSGGGDTEERGPSAAGEADVSIDAVLNDTDALLGRTVTVTAEVERVLGPHAVVIGDVGLLVVGRYDPQPFVEATAVVTGEVIRFDAGEVEAALGIELGEEFERRFRGETAILADRLRLIR